MARFNGASVFQRRKVGGAVRRMGARGQLQWGLRLSTEEGKSVALKFIQDLELQWGLRLSTEEGFLVLTDTVADGPLQWGLRLSTEEGRHQRTGRRSGHDTSMGPPSFNGGRSMTRSRLVGARANFNGASVFQRRKGASILSRASAMARLQWGLRLSTEEGSCEPPRPLIAS